MSVQEIFIWVPNAEDFEEFFVPIWILGTLVFATTFALKKETNRQARVIVRSLILALTFAPGIAIGEGIGHAPAAYIFFRGGWRDERMLRCNLGSILVTWILMLLLCLIATYVWNAIAKRRNSCG